MLRSADIGVGLSFQNTWPEASMRSLIGSGGVVSGGGWFVRCGKSMSIGYDRIGAVTMKMISNTSITSTRGVTLMSAIGMPVAELELKAILGAPYGRSLVAMKPTLAMPCCWATFTTSLTIRYLVVLSPRTLTSGCGVFCASTDSWLSSWSRGTGASFQYRWPSSCTVTVIGGVGGTASGRLSRFACGSSTLILCDISGAVIMKMMSKTNITSTRGVTLISDIGAPLWAPELKAMGRTPSRYGLALGRQFADAGASGEEVVQVMREGVELVVGDPVQAHEEVVAEHRRDRREQ